MWLSSREAPWGIVLLGLQSFAKAQTAGLFFTVNELVNSRFGQNQAKTIVRLAFHDAMGGVDGRLNQGDSEHNGVVGILNDIGDLYNDNQGAVSPLGRSDFFAWAYVAAFYMTVPNNSPWVPLNFGRADVGNGASEDIPPGSEFGSPDHDAVLSYFSSNFGFSASDTAIILGAHTLGGADRGNSGYVGDWTNSPDTFNAQYYRTLVDPPQNTRWEQVEISTNKFEWRWGCNGGGGNNGCRDLMLNADMALFFDIDYDSTGRAILPAGSSCSSDRIFDDCFPVRNGGTENVVSDLSNGNQDNDFRNQFASVYGRMINRVKTSSSLTTIGEPANWPEGLNGGGDDNDENGNNGGGIGACFSESATVHVQAKGFVPMKDLQVGDLVWTGKFEPVYAFGHHHDSLSSNFVRITVDASSQEPLELTGNHLLHVADESGKFQPLRADQVKVGDTVESSLHGHSNKTVRVAKIATVTKEGIYMPLTASGTIVVNGILASCYVGLENDLPPRVLEIGSWFLSEESLLHWWLAPYRILSLGVSSAFGTAFGPYKDWEQGKHPWLVAGQYFATVVEELPLGVQVGVVALPLWLVFGSLRGLESLVGSALVPVLLVAILWIFAIKRKERKVEKPFMSSDGIKSQTKLA